MKTPAFQFYPSDFLMGTMIMSAEEVGAYIRLLCFQWDKGAIPDDDAALAKIGGCQANAVASVRHKFGKAVGMPGLQNRRLEEVRQKQLDYRKKQAKRANDRWAKESEDATALPAQCSPSSVSGLQSSSSSTNKKTVGRIAAAPAPTAGELIALLSKEAAYEGIGVPREVEKCRLWCQSKGKKFSKQRVINWLNRAEAPLLTDARPTGPDPYREPDGWRPKAQNLFPDTEFSDRVKDGMRWQDVSLEVRQKIISTHE